MGYVVFAGGHKTEPNKVKATKDMLSPCTKKGVSRFLGMILYYQTLMSEPPLVLIKQTSTIKVGDTATTKLPGLEGLADQ